MRFAAPARARREGLLQRPVIQTKQRRSQLFSIDLRYLVRILENGVRSLKFPHSFRWRSTNLVRSLAPFRHITPTSLATPGQAVSTWLTTAPPRLTRLALLARLTRLALARTCKLGLARQSEPRAEFLIE